MRFGFDLLNKPHIYSLVSAADAFPLAFPLHLMGSVSWFHSFQFLPIDR